VRYACEDIVSLRARVRGLETDIELRLSTHEVGKLLTTIPGVSTLTAARIITETGDPAQFRSAGAFASYIGAVPRLHQSGKKRYSGKPAIPLGNARLRRALWMLRFGRHSPQSLAAYLLPTPSQRGQTSQGRHHCRYAPAKRLREREFRVGDAGHRQLPYYGPFRLFTGAARPESNIRRSKRSFGGRF
jgi:transposase